MPKNNTSSNLAIKSVIAFLLLVIVGAVIYMYINIFILKAPEQAPEVVKTQREIDNDRRLAQITAPPKNDQELDENRGSEIRSDLRTKPEVSMTGADRSQLEQ